MDDDAFADIKRGSIRELKNSEAMGLPIEQEAELLSEAVQEFEKLMDGAIAKGRNVDDAT